MADYPEISPDGSTILFSWRGDIWTASTKGGEATRLTTHPARDFAPHYTPDGQSICFNSLREGKHQAFIMPSNGGTAKQLTFHSEGAILQDIAPDGKSILIQGIRDYAGRKPYRLFQVNIDQKSPEHRIFNAYAENGRFSPDGKSIIFTREGVQTYRKGYHGTMASQVWTWTQGTESKDTFTKPVSSDYGCRNPIYTPEAKGFYYTSGSPNGFNLWHHDFSTKENRQVTHFEDDSVMQPAISNNGNTLVFRHLFDLYTLDLSDTSNNPVKLNLWHTEDLENSEPQELIIKETKDACFSPSGLEIAFAAEGDIWAMDTVLRKPNRLTNTLGHERDIWFSHNGKSIFYIYDDGISTEIRKLEKAKPSKYWWETSDSKETTIVKASEKPLSVIPSPKGKKIAYTTYPGNLWICDSDGSDPVRLLESWDQPDVRWSPDGKWLAYAVYDNDFNSDVYVIAADGSGAPVNISRHPDNDFMPRWSPDGRRLAFVGRHHKDQYDLFYVDLYHSDIAKDKDGETRERARKAMKKDPAYKSKAKKVVEKAIDTLTKGEEKPKKKEKKESFNFENITQRVKRLEIKGSTPNNVIWDKDSKRILFQTRTGKTTFAIETKPAAKPSKFADAKGTPLHMSKSGRLFWLSDGVPAVLSGGKNTKYPFTIYTHRNQEDWKRMTFRTAWSTMRDGFYDPELNGRDWTAVLEKYEDAAASIASDSRDFDRIANMMLGELNASHMGFRSKTWPAAWKPRSLWKEETVHLGLRFDPDHNGQGWLVQSVIPDSPATHSISKIQADERIIEVADQEVSPQTPLASVLTRRISEPLWLTVADKNDKERKVKIKPISYTAARTLVREARIDDTETAVDKLSKGTLGYIHVARMMWDEFEKFEHHLYEQGAGKKGIVIDVRDNGGGFTTDHLLTALCQPRHAFTIPRNGAEGYPHDRIVYATWNKPIIVLCNQNSFSNAEIFAHAIRNLGRGKIVGVTTAGGVISTGQASIMGATMRMPFRGWFDAFSGQDMELNGAKPHYKIWNQPGQLTAGKDIQLEKAVSVLLKESSAAKQGPKARYRNASSQEKNLTPTAANQLEIKPQSAETDKTTQ